MSALHPMAAATRRAVSVHAPLDTVTIRWSLSRAALRAAGPAAGLAQTFAKIADAGPDLELRWKLNLDEGTAEAMLFDAGTGTEHALAKGMLRHTHDGDLLHFEVREGSEARLAATVRTGATETRVLYAQTGILAMLGLRGGRYEVM